MGFNRIKLREILLYLIPLVCAGMLNLVDGVPFRINLWNRGVFQLVHSGVLASLLIEAVYIQWAFSIRRRFPQKQMRSNTTLFAAAFILLSLFPVIKYSFVTQGGTAARYLWYA
nr:hypothetical protein [Clostridiales bacterium]